MKRLIGILVIVIIAVALVLSSLGSQTIQNLQAGFLGLIGPFLETGSAVQEQIGSMGKGLQTLEQLEQENLQLKTENKELRTTNKILRDIEAENNALRSALEYKRRSVFRLVPAQVIARDASTWWNTIKINRGFEDGLDVGDQTVLTDVGLVGKTITVGKNISTVLLITDETCKVAAKVEGSPEQGILSGRRLQEAGTGEMQLDFLTKTADLQPGQKVYTAGVSGGVFPSGILVGTVASFKARALDGQAMVTTAVDLSSVEDVFVVVGAK